MVVAVNDGAALAELKLFGPLQLYVGLPVPLTPVALRFIAVPTQRANGDALTLVIVGNELTVTEADVAFVEQEPAVAVKV